MLLQICRELFVRKQQAPLTPQAAIGGPPSLDENWKDVHESTCVLGNMNKEESKILQLRLWAVQAILIPAYFFAARAGKSLRPSFGHLAGHEAKALQTTEVFGLFKSSSFFLR